MYLTRGEVRQPEIGYCPRPSRSAEAPTRSLLLARHRRARQEGSMTTSEQRTDRIRLVPAATTDGPAVQPPAAPADGPTAPPTTVDVPSVSVVVPTRNERDNIEPLLERLHA